MGTEAFWIPAVIAAAGTAGNAINQSNATKRANNATVQGMDNQAQIRNQAMSQVNKQTMDLAHSNPQSLAQNETSNFVNTLRKNVGGTTGTTSTSPATFGAPTSSLSPTPSGSSRYKSDATAAAGQTESYGNTNASDVSAIDSALNQRKGEALNMQTLGTNLNLLSAKSQSQQFVDKMRATAEGQPSPWVSLFSNLTGGIGQSMAKNGWFTKKSGTPNYLGGGGIGGTAGDASQIAAPSWGANLSA